MQTSIPVKQKISYMKHNLVEEAATNLGTFELINYKEVLKGTLLLNCSFWGSFILVLVISSQGLVHCFVTNICSPCFLLCWLFVV